MSLTTMVNSGYTSYRSGHQCASTITSGQDVTFIAPTPVGLNWDTGTAVTNMATETALVKGDGIPIWWQSSDSAVLSAAAAQTPSSTAAETSKSGGGLIGEPTESNASGSAASPSTSNTALGQSNSGLSTGAKAGIGVGVSLGVIVIGLVMGFFLWRRRRSRSKPIGELPTQTGYAGAGKTGPPPVMYQRQEMEPAEPVYPRHEMEGETRHELPGSGYK